MASRRGLQIVLMTPNLEGLLVRLHEGREAHAIAASDADGQLRKLWPEYKKGSLSADRLRRRFALTDLRRAALHDEELRQLLGRGVEVPYPKRALYDKQGGRVLPDGDRCQRWFT